MYQLSERCDILRKEMVDLKSNMKNYCIQRMVYYALGAKAAEKKGLTYDEIYAAGTANVLRRFTPFIAPGELITGFNYGDAK